MKLQIASVLLLLPWRLQALTYEEAGVLDFTIATAGHGPLQTGSLSALAENAECVLTSDAGANEQGSSCYVACRSPRDGSLKWRRNVCSSTTDEAFSVVFDPTSQRVVSVDASSVVRSWSATEGSLLWEQQLARDVAWTSLKVDNVGEVQVASRSKVQVLGTDKGDFISERGGSHSFEKQRQQSSLQCRDRLVSVDSSRTRLDTGNGEVLDMALAIGDEIEDLRLLSCNDDSSASLLVLSTRGGTNFVSCSSKSCETMWTAHEGLSSVSQALLLDSSHKLKYSQVDKLLSYRSRLASQWKRISSLALFESTETNSHLFGFIKSAVLLSPATHAVYGLDTTGAYRGKISFVVNLPRDEEIKHVLVHGAPNSPKSAHGFQGGTLSKQVLILSHSGHTMHWTCVDGTTGTVLAEESNLSLSSPVTQILPMTASVSSDGCQQSAMIVLKDGSIVHAPRSDEVKRSMQAALTSAPNGFYAHVVDTERALLETFWAPSMDSKVVPSGLSSFSAERIVRVAYPRRDEVISSPTVALGDNSLLIKYMNPHLMVIITMRDDTAILPGTKSAISSALEVTANEGKGKQLRKPAGATADGGSASTAGSEEPNLFVNLVDSVSGRILHRVSHANSMSYPQPAVAISENWIYYTFSNTKTRRAELGVLSLYEGMIDSKGLSAFTTPEQSNSYSSLDARESKPLVLAKSYSLARPVTAIGVTTTHRGISNHKLILAGIDGQIYGIDRKSLDPRRPVGELKDFEKKEGLMRYSEFVPMIPLMSLSYNQTIEGVKSIITASTDLESQSLVMAFGGSDVFFTRTSPSRGFDLLPDSFSRPLLSILVIGLLLVLVIVKRRASSKMKLSGWL